MGETKKVVPSDNVDGETTTEDKKEEEKKALKPVGFHKLMAFADALDITMFTAGIIMAAIQGFVQVYMIVFFGDIMDTLFEADDDQTMEFVRWFCYLGVIAFGSGWLQYTCTNTAAERQKSKLRLAYLNAVIHQDVAWFDCNEPGTLPERISSNIEKMALGLGDKAGNVAMCLSMLVTGFAFGFYYWWQLSLVILAVVPLMALGSAAMGQALTDLQNENQTWYGKAGACAEEVMRALRTVVAFRGEQAEIDRYHGYLAHARRGGIIAQAKVGFGMGYTMGIMTAAYGIAFWAGAYFMKDGMKQPNGDPYQAGDTLKVFFCVLFAGFALGMLGEPAQTLTAACAAGANFYEVVNSKPTIESAKKDKGSDAKAAISSIDKISFDNVHFSYPARPDTKVLNGTSLTINGGQKVALVGESGSGKSTIISLLERFYDPAEGTVMINDVDIKTLNPSSLRSLIGYVGQEPVLFATSILNNIMYGNPDATRGELEEVQQQAQLDFVGTMAKGLDTFVGSGGNQFSGGQKQRIALARALIKKPHLLLLDEATSALDNKSEKMVQETLDKLSNSYTKALTTIEIAHRLSTVMNRDKIFVMRKGVVVEEGTHTELLAQHGVYESLVAAQGGAKRKSQSNDLTAEEVTSVEGDGMLSSIDDRASVEKVKDTQDEEVLDPDKLEEKRKEEILKTYSAPMSRIFAFCKPEWICLVPGTIGALLFGAKEPMIAYVLFQAIEKFYIPDKNVMYEEVVVNCWYFALIGVGCFVGGFLQYLSFGFMKEGLTLRMREATIRHLLRMEVGYHDDPDHTPAKNVFALEMYAFRTGNMVTAIGAYAGVFGSLVVGVGIAFIVSWKMSLMMLAMIPVMAVTQYISFVMMMGASGGTNEELKTAQQVISDSLNSIRTVRAMGIEDTLVNLVANWAKPVTGRGIKKAFMGGFNFGISQGLVFFIFAFAFWWAMWLIKNGHNTFVEAMQAMGCILFGAMGMGSAMSMVGDAGKAKVACHDLFKLLDRVSLIDGLSPTGETPSGEIEAVGRIEFKDVKFFYPFRQDVQVLKGITFSIKEGQSVGLCGPSGGGKSTILALLQRFYDPQEGEILITEHKMPLHKVNIAWWRKQMGYIGQEPILFDTTVRENVLYGMDPNSVTQEHLDKCSDMACLDFLKEQDGWETKVGPRGERLSGGQKQRVAICRAIVRDPQIMLLDEATSALDTASEQVVQQALNNVLIARTSFTIAHRLSTIEKCDIILACAEGVIVESGTHDELMAKDGVYARLQKATDK